MPSIQNRKCQLIRSHDKLSTKY